MDQLRITGEEARVKTFKNLSFSDKILNIIEKRSSNGFQYAKIEIKNQGEFRQNRGLIMKVLKENRYSKVSSRSEGGELFLTIKW